MRAFSFAGARKVAALVHARRRPATGGVAAHFLFFLLFFLVLFLFRRYRRHGYSAANDFGVWFHSYLLLVVYTYCISEDADVQLIFLCALSGISRTDPEGICW
jgi:hypothetical protein